ncbi:MAG: DUF3667 domain-containing protein [Bacteroidetes bacterium]|nr:DUF3667 domain-containing protein [Bacteroidota bacterium]
MKHHLRKENNCLNCGSIVAERYCSHCGQENTEPRETVGHLVGHFFADITHFDSKLFTTIKLLLFKPGFLTTEYFAGKRTKYLNPIRMYVFISAVFFLSLFLINNHEETINEDEGNAHAMNILKQHLADSLRQSIHWPAKANVYDSARIQALKDISTSLDTVAAKKLQDEEISFHLGGKGATFVLREDRFNTVKEYDSVQLTLPDSSKNKGFLNWLIRSNVRLKEKYGSRRQVMVSENFQHSIPKIMFLLLPVFALLIYLMQNKKNYYYAQHLIYSVHFHSFLFFLLFVLLLISLIPLGNGSQAFLALASWIFSFIYLVISLKKVYGQAYGWAILKGFFILILYAIMLVLGILSIAIISFFTA